MKVLICDDEALARERLARFLKDMDGYQIVGEAENGQDALDQAALTSPDIVLLDLRMPVMDGLACAEKLAQLPEPPAVIFCTSMHWPRLKCRRWGICLSPFAASS